MQIEKIKFLIWLHGFLSNKIPEDKDVLSALKDAIEEFEKCQK